jgi:hypothetical protein
VLIWETHAALRLSIRRFENEFTSALCHLTSAIVFLFSVPNTEHDDPAARPDEPDPSSIAAHPCKKRKDGAPSALVVPTKIQNQGRATRRTGEMGYTIIAVFEVKKEIPVR